MAKVINATMQHKALSFLTGSLATLCLTFAICLTFPNIAFGHPVVDTSGATRGSISISQKDSAGNAVGGGVVSVVKVADATLARYTGDALFVWREGWGDSGETVDIDSLDDGAVAAELSNYMEDAAAVADAVEQRTLEVNTDGRAVFNDLDVGLYLVTQTKPPAGRDAFNPFLVSVPMLDDAGEAYIYDVDASPKVAPFALIDQTPDNPGDPENPDNPDEQPNNPPSGEDESTDTTVVPDDDIPSVDDDVENPKNNTSKSSEASLDEAEMPENFVESPNQTDGGDIVKTPISLTNTGDLFRLKFYAVSACAFISGCVLLFVRKARRYRH